MVTRLCTIIAPALADCILHNPASSWNKTIPAETTENDKLFFPGPLVRVSPFIVVKTRPPPPHKKADI
jgi:hypothetical protein